MAKFSNLKGGKEVGSAEVYAAPHTSTGKALPVQEAGTSNNAEYTNSLALSVGNVRGRPYPATKTDGIKTRGNGAAIKGITARGPMA